ncbi:MAG: hypothetical protein A3J74_08770 [Elusimicrobia bacterium RIFCSPHIGHO2_02_FULL_57_9]|nr:MAG: hypothetical protein A3J74_08770 [Elusimicrobia bacterium RIFCSPHIGHO2_02_FULL_57_9]
MSLRPRLGFAAVLTGLLFLSRFYPLPALKDAVTGLAVCDAGLYFPPLHLFFTPFYSLADLVACNSATQDIAFLFYLLLGCGLIFRLKRSLKSLALYWLLVAVFLAWAALIPHDFSGLRLNDPDILAVDFHSHTSHSWDGRATFTPARNLAWHKRAGFDAGFITDHNKTAGAVDGKALSRLAWSSGQRAYASLEGEELSLHDCHVVALGNSRHIDARQYLGLEGLKKFLNEAGAVHGALPLMSLPEYWKRGWQLREDYASWGAKGFEISNGAPQGANFPEDKRRTIIELCRRHNLFVAAASDNHGYGSAGCAWNLMKIPGWQALDPDQRQRAVLETLRREEFKAVRVIIRNKIEPVYGDMIWVDTPRALWRMARCWTWPQSISAFFWILLIALPRPNSLRRLPIKA